MKEPKGEFVAIYETDWEMNVRNHTIYDSADRAKEQMTHLLFSDPHVRRVFIIDLRAAKVVSTLNLQRTPPLPWNDKIETGF